MSSSAQDILNFFDVLPESEQRLVVSEIMRRTSHWDSAPLTDDEMTLAAEALFLSLDERERSDAQPESR